MNRYAMLGAGFGIALLACSSDLNQGAEDGAGGSSDEGSSGEGGNGGSGGSTFGGMFDNADPDAALPDPELLKPPMPNPEAFWEDDPPPMMCLEDGSMGPPPTPPGGTPDCPDDKNREGCPCPEIGESAACWPGLRANRNRGICRDGTAECVEHGEFGGVWGPCEGYVGRMFGAVAGPSACTCFSMGSWVIDNISPCFVSYQDGSIYAISTAIGADGMAACPADPGGPPPQPTPGTTWSTSTLQVDCAGRFELCYTLKAGDFMNPQPSDCTLSQSCVETWYEEAGVVQDLPELPAWSSTNVACANDFQVIGGYGEMTVKGLSVECDPVDDGSGNEYVFNRISYCPASCNTTPDTPECMNCRMGGSGDF